MAEENNDIQEKVDKSKTTVQLTPITPLDEEGAKDIPTLRTFFNACAIRQADSSIDFSNEDFLRLLSEEAIAVINDMLYLHHDYEVHKNNYTDKELGEEGWRTLPAREILKRILEVINDKDVNASTKSDKLKKITMEFRVNASDGQPLVNFLTKLRKHIGEPNEKKEDVKRWIKMDVIKNLRNDTIDSHFLRVEVERKFSAAKDECKSFSKGRSQIDYRK